MRHFILIVALTVCLAHPIQCGEPSADRGKWVSISDGVLEQLGKEGKKPAWPGMAAGIGVDRASGDVYMIIS